MGFATRARESLKCSVAAMVHDVNFLLRNWVIRIVEMSRMFKMSNFVLDILDKMSYNLLMKVQEYIKIASTPALGGSIKAVADSLGKIIGMFKLSSVEAWALPASRLSTLLIV